MAWNEPGNSGNKDKDPWGKKKDNQGPPDLEEVFKNFGKKISSIFGGKGGGGSTSGGGSSSGGMGMFALIAIVAVLAWGVSGIYIVEEGNEGIVLTFGTYDENDKTYPGPHWYPRFIQEVDIVDVQQSRTILIGRNDDESLMLTRDNSIVAIRFEVQYLIKDAKKYLYNVIDPEATLKQVTESVLREIVGANTFDYVVETNRHDVGPAAKILIQQFADRYSSGIEITLVNVQAADPPLAVKDAFDDVVTAKKDYDRYIKVAEEYKKKILPIANGDAARMVKDAEAYQNEVVERAKGDALRFNSVLREYKKAPRVTRDRLYIEAMESVLSNSNKVMIDVEGGNNIMYLPLDQLHKRDNSNSGNRVNSGSSSSRSNVGVPPSNNTSDSNRSRSNDRSRN